MSFETSGVYDEMQEINKSLKSVVERLDNIEQDSCKKEHIQRRPHTGERETPTGSNSANTLLGAYSQGHDSGHPRPTSVQPLDTVNAPGIDIQGEFAAIKESLQRIKLPAELRLNDSNKQQYVYMTLYCICNPADCESLQNRLYNKCIFIKPDHSVRWFD